MCSLLGVWFFLMTQTMLPFCVPLRIPYSTSAFVLPEVSFSPEETLKESQLQINDSTDAAVQIIERRVLRSCHAAPDSQLKFSVDAFVRRVRA